MPGPHTRRLRDAAPSAWQPAGALIPSSKGEEVRVTAGSAAPPASVVLGSRGCYSGVGSELTRVEEHCRGKSHSGPDDDVGIQNPSREMPAGNRIAMAQILASAPVPSENYKRNPEP